MSKSDSEIISRCSALAWVKAAVVFVRLGRSRVSGSRYEKVPTRKEVSECVLNLVFSYP